MSYCFDSSSFINPWKKWYPPETFPTVWQRIDALIDEDKIIASDEVFRELEKQADDLHAWLKKRRQVFVPLDEDIQRTNQEILNKFPNLVDYKKQRSQADPFVIATAIVKEKILVTEEKSINNPNKPKIPDVCLHFGVECITFLQFMQREKWTF